MEFKYVKLLNLLSFFAILILGVLFFGVSSAQAADRYWVGGTGNWSDDDNHWATTSGGAPADTNIPTASDNCIFDSLSNTTAYTVTVDASATCLDLNFSAAPATSGTITFAGSSALAISGNMTLLSGMSFTYTGIITFNATSGTNTITSNGVTITGALTLDGVGGTWQLVDALTIDSTKTITLTNGTFNANDKNVTMGGFTVLTGTKVLTMGTGTWTLAGNSMSLWLVTDATGMTFNKGSSPIIANYSGSTGTRTFLANAAFGMNSPDFNITAGSDSITMGGNFGSINFTGFSGILNGSTRSLYGSLTLSSSMTVSLAAAPAVTTFAATSGTHTIITNGKTIGFSVNFNGVGGTWQLGDDLTMNSARNMTLTNGTFNANNKNVTTGRFLSSGSAVRTLNMGSGVWNLGSTSTVWNLVSTNLTLNEGTSTIKITDTSATARTFSGGGETYNNFWSDAGASAANLTIEGSNIFNEFKDTGTAAHSILFTTGTTQNIKNFNVSGSAGNEITINSGDGASGTSTSSHALVKSGNGTVSSDYLNIQHSIVTPANTWYAGDNSVDNQSTTTAGSGWIFTPPPVPSSSGSRSARSTNTPAVLTPAPTAPSTDTTACIPGNAYSTVTGAKCPELSTPTPGPNNFIFLNNLKAGVTHPDVLKLQQYLNTHNFFLATIGPGSPNNETNFFGSLTRAAVIKFQIAKSLTPDGIVGPITRGALNASN